MDKTVLNIKTDKVLKEKAQKVARDMGLPLGTIMNHYLRKLTDERRVIFQAPQIPNKKTAKLLMEASDDYRMGRNIAGPFATTKEMDNWLDS